MAILRIHDTGLLYTFDQFSKAIFFYFLFKNNNFLEKLKFWKFKSIDVKSRWNTPITCAIRGTVMYICSKKQQSCLFEGRIYIKKLCNECTRYTVYALSLRIVMGTCARFNLHFSSYEKCSAKNLTSAISNFQRGFLRVSRHLRSLSFFLPNNAVGMVIMKFTLAYK